ncbi:hypothetical protein [Pantoea dispersa]|uniref:hypothetical protein n=1 Tax=Pantoea dispersa TaxID=59814 RepID=UPI0014796869|nr:hypothetical protein [Pantoea dispersa]
MKKILQQWLARLAASKAGTPDGREFDPGEHIDLLIPISQLYGVEFHPSVYRYYER